MHKRKGWGEIGEVWIKTPTIVLGYHKDSERTQGEFYKGWYKTGDIGKIDEAGYLYTLGRRDDMIIKSGMNIYPQEIERKIVELQEIKEV